MTLLSLLLACATPSTEVRKAPFVPTEDPREPASNEDSQPPDPEGEQPEEEPDPPEEEPVEPTTGTTMCFPGPDDQGDMCLDVIPWDPSWGSDYDYPSSSDARYATPLRYIDITAWDAGFDVARNFTLGEFVQSTKGRYGLLQPHFVRSLQGMRDELGAPLYVHSGYRNPAYNAGVGGVQFSRHQWGDAADMHTDVMGLTELGELCADHGAAYVGYYESHVHCDWRDDPLEPALFSPAAAARTRLTLPRLAARLQPGPLWTAPAEGWDEGEPLREWTALDAAGDVLVQATGSTFAPPSNAATVRVVVGREVVVTEPCR